MPYIIPQQNVDFQLPFIKYLRQNVRLQVSHHKSPPMDGDLGFSRPRRQAGFAAGVEDLPRNGIPESTAVVSSARPEVTDERPFIFSAACRGLPYLKTIEFRLCRIYRVTVLVLCENVHVDPSVERTEATHVLVWIESVVVP